MAIDKQYDKLPKSAANWDNGPIKTGFYQCRKESSHVPMFDP